MSLDERPTIEEMWEHLWAEAEVGDVAHEREDLLGGMALRIAMLIAVGVILGIVIPHVRLW